MSLVAGAAVMIAGMLLLSTIDAKTHIVVLSLYMALLGIGQPVRRLEAQPKDNDVSFVAAIDGAAVAILLDKAQDMLLPR